MRAKVSRALTLERRSALANVPRPGLRPGLLLDFAKAHHLSRDARSTFAAEASTHPLGSASWNGLAQDGTVGDMDVDDEAPWTGSRRVPAWARPFRGAPHGTGGSSRAVH